MLREEPVKFFQRQWRQTVPRTLVRRSVPKPASVDIGEPAIGAHFKPANGAEPEQEYLYPAAGRAGNQFSPIRLILISPGLRIWQRWEATGARLRGRNGSGRCEPLREPGLPCWRESDKSQGIGDGLPKSRPWLFKWVDCENNPRSQLGHSIQCFRLNGKVAGIRVGPCLYTDATVSALRGIPSSVPASAGLL
jgi:hypothetical protein